MNTIQIKITTIMTSIRRKVLDQLWFVGLMTPLAVLTVLGVMRYSEQYKIGETIHNEKKFIIAGANISTAELSRIVSLPLRELIVIRVYFDSYSNKLHGDTVMMSAFSSPHRSRENVSILMLAYQLQRSNSDTTICPTYCNRKENPVILEQA